MPLIARTKGTKPIFANISATNKDTDLKCVYLSRGYSHNILQAGIHPIIFVILQSITNYIAAIFHCCSICQSLLTNKLIYLQPCTVTWLTFCLSIYMIIIKKITKTIIIKVIMMITLIMIILKIEDNNEYNGDS